MYFFSYGDGVEQRRYSVGGSQATRLRVSSPHGEYRVLPTGKWWA